MKTKIIYEDKQVLVCYKPAGFPTQTARIGMQDVVSELKNYLAAAARNGLSKPVIPYLGVIHRLDQPVEGLLVFAKDEKTAAALTAQLRQGKEGQEFLHKKYYAVTCGKPAAEAGKLVDFLWKDEKTNTAMIVTGQEQRYPQSKKAVLHYRIAGKEDAVLGACVSEVQFYLMDISIETGRFHQIRAQMAHAGMPLLGDVKYGTEESGRISAAVAVRNVALCAYEVTFTHPVTGRKLSFQVKPEGRIFQPFFTKEN